MSYSPITAGLASSTAVQGAAASPSLDEQLTQLGALQRAALNQAQVLARVSASMQASAVMGPGFLIPENEANAILADAALFPGLQAAIQSNVEDPASANASNLVYAAALFAAHSVGKARSEQANQFDLQVQSTVGSTNFAGMVADHLIGATRQIEKLDDLSDSVQKLLFSGGDTATTRLNINRYRARQFFIEAVDFNKSVLADYNRFTVLYDKLSREVKGPNKTTDLDEWRLQEGDTSNFSREQRNLTDHIRAIESQIKRHYHSSQAMTVMDKDSKDSSERDTTFIIPLGVEKVAGKRQDSQPCVF